MASGSGTFSNYPGGFAGGVNVQGMPVWNMFSTSAGPSNRANSGVFWVSSTTGADGNAGTQGDPIATLSRALAICKARDWIMLMPGHVETISTSTALTLSVANVTIVGLGLGAQRPTFTLDTANTATVNVTAAGVSVINCIFVANFLSIAACFTLTNAPGFSLIENQFRSTSNVLNFGKLVLTDSTSNHADDLTLMGNRWFDAGTTSAQSVIGMVGTNARLSVQGNYFSMAATTGAALMPISTTKSVTNAVIQGNVFSLVQATNLATGILITTDVGTNSGIISGNLIQGLDATTEILCTAASGFMFSQNYYSGVADTSGYLLPTADS